MKILSQILRFILALAIGMAAGFIIAACAAVIFTDITFAGFFDKLVHTDLSEGIIAALVGVASFAVSVPLLIIIHEAGHLVCGLLSGYRFVSFRVFDFTFIREDGRLRVKRFAVAGTGGQCLLAPPDVPAERLPTVLYNLGGILANLLFFLLALPLLWAGLSPFAAEFVVIFLLTDAILILTNGIPMSLGGVGNDGYNVLLMRRSPQSRRALMVQLRSNALVQEGVRPGDMPEEWFEVPAQVDYRNPMEVSLPLMHASRLVDLYRWEEARREFEDIYARREGMLKIYVLETACELVFASLVTGHVARAAGLLDKELRRYIDTYRRVMSSKERVLCAMALYIDGDRDRAQEIYDGLLARSDGYLLQGEVKGDLACMERMLADYDATVFRTDRLLMRPWREDDAEALYKYASDPAVGTPAGWPAHESVEMSREVIREVFSAPETYAVVLRETGEPIGCVGVVPPECVHVEGMAPGDVEIGYWLGRPWWGKGIIPEAVTALCRRLREGGAASLWISLAADNDKSRRVAEKCGFTHHHSTQTEHFYLNPKR